MMLSSDLTATELGYWRRVRSELNMSVLGIAVALALLISTQVLFQPHLFEMWELVDIVIAWARYFGEVLAISVAMVLAVAMAEHSAVGPGPQQALLVIAALALPPQVLAVIFAWGYTGTPIPASPLSLFGEALKYSLIGAFLLGVRAVHRRALRAADEARAAHAAHSELERQVDEAQLQLLQAQIEPHFLFNTLANVRQLYRKQPAAGAEAIDNLLVYLHAALPQLRRKTSTLADEFELVQAYLQLFQVRLGERLHFSLDLPPSLRGVPFPPTVLVTLAENAIKHGITPTNLGGTIRIGATGNGEGVEVTVSDDGVGFGAGMGGNGTGLIHVRRQLAARYADAAQLTLEQADDGGVRARILVPQVPAKAHLFFADRFLTTADAKPL
jgi:hypothetical protein